jgi:hypothetical protein
VRYTEDFVLRLISQASAVLAHALGLKKAGKEQEALQTIDQALEILLGMRADMLNQMEDSSVLSLVTMNGHLDRERTIMVARLFKEQGDILVSQDRKEESHAQYLRAIKFYAEAALNDSKVHLPEYFNPIDELYQKLKGQPAPVEAQLAWLDYFERLADLPGDALMTADISREYLDNLLVELRAGVRQYIDLD